MIATDNTLSKAGSLAEDTRTQADVAARSIDDARRRVEQGGKLATAKALQPGRNRNTAKRNDARKRGEVHSRDERLDNGATGTGAKSAKPATYNKRHAFKSAFSREAAQAYAEQKPAGGRMIIWLALACLAVLIGWASVAQVQEVARGEGKVIPSQSVQMVQSVDGGAIAEILTREGAAVRKDQPLIRIETVRADAQKSESLVHLYSLRAKIARLTAESGGAERVAFDADTAAIAADAVAREASLFNARRAEFQTSLRVLDGQIAQRIQEANEAAARRQANVASLALIDQEVRATRPLVSTGAVSAIEVLRLERDLVRTQGEAQMAATQIERLNAAIAETRQRRREIEDQFRSRARTDLNEAAGEQIRLEQNIKGLDDRVTKTVLRSPVDGVVKTLHMKSVGSVIQPGKEVVEIVPTDDTLLLEARIPPRDIANLHLGQQATVRLTAYDFTTYGGLSGTLEHISADTVADEKGNAFYIVRVRTVKPDSAGNAIGSKARPIIAGMTASVDVLTGKKTVLNYLLKPIVRAREKAFTER